MSVDEQEQINIEELRKKNYFEIKDSFIKEDDKTRRWQFETKAKVITVMAEKLKEEGWPIFEVREKILEDLGDRITRPYLTKCLPDEFKKAVNVEKGKRLAEQNAAKKAQTNAGSAGAATVMEEPEQDFSDRQEDENTPTKTVREPLPDIRPKLESESEVETKPDIDPSNGMGLTILALQNTISQQQEKLELQTKVIEELERKVKALGGELPYQDCLSTYRVIKSPKNQTPKLSDALTKSKAFTQLLVDIRTNELINVYTDAEWKKQTTFKKQ